MVPISGSEEKHTQHAFVNNVCMLVNNVCMQTYSHTLGGGGECGMGGDGFLSFFFHNFKKLTCLFFQSYRCQIFVTKDFKTMATNPKQDV